MKNKLLIAGLSLTLALAPSVLAEASDSSEVTMTTTSEKNDVQYSYYTMEVRKVTYEEVVLSFMGLSRTGNTSTNSTEHFEITLPRKLFDDDIIERDVYELRSKKNLNDITKSDVIADDIKLVNKFEKTDDKEVDELPEDASSKDFVVIKVNVEDGEKYALLEEVGNDRTQYLISANNLRDEDVKVDNQYKIYWDGRITASQPAKFGELYRVEKLDKSKEDDKVENTPIDKLPEDVSVGTYVVKKINEDEEKPSVVLYSEDNHRLEYVVDMDQLRDDDVNVNDRYKIYTNGIVFQSFPAKFSHIYRVEELDHKKEDDDKFENMAIDKIPEDHEVMEFEILEINRDLKKPTVILTDRENKESKYVIELEKLMNKYPKVGDVHKIYWDGVILKSDPAQFGKIYRVELVKEDKYDESYTKSLAISMFDSLVQTQAASILLDQTPKTVEKIEPSLNKLMGNANTLMEDAYTNFLTEEEREKGSKDTALLKIMEYKYDKKLEKESDKELALSIFQNVIMVDASKMLLENTPETVKSIEKELKEKVESSEKLVEDAINTLK